MAGVQVPTLGRVDIAPEGPSPRLNVNPVNEAPALEKVSNAVSGLGDNLMKYQDVLTDRAAYTHAAEVTNTYQQEHEAGLEKLKYSEGDPSKLYTDFSDHMADRFKELNGDESLPSKTRQAVAQMLVDKANQLQLRTSSMQAGQQAKYDDNITRTSIKLAQGGMTDATTYMTPDAEGKRNTSLFDRLIGEIQQKSLNHAAGYGGVIPIGKDDVVPKGPDGQPMQTLTMLQSDGSDQKVAVNNSTLYDIRKDQSDGIYNAINNAIGAKQPELARFLLDKYGDNLLGDKRILRGAIKDNTDKLAALQAANDLYKIKDSDTIDKELKNRGYSLEQQELARKYIHEHQLQAEYQTKLADNDRFNAAAKNINDRNNSGAPYSGPLSFYEDPTISGIVPLMRDQSKVKKLQDMAYANPKDTPVQTKSAVRTFLAGQDPDHPLMTTSEEDFQAMIANASRADKKKFENQRRALTDASVPGLSKQYADMHAAIERAAIRSHYINRTYGKIQGDDEVRRNELYDQMDHDMAAWGHTRMTPDQITQIAGDYLAAAVQGKEKDFQMPAPPKFNGSRQATPPPATGQSPKVNNDTGGKNIYIRPDGTSQIESKSGVAKKKSEWVIQYQKENGRLPDQTTDWMKKFLDNH